MPRFIPVQTLLLLLSVLGSCSVRAESPLPSDVQPGSLLLRMQSGYVTATLMDTDVSMDINGLVARVAVRQRFRNEGSEWVEGVYVFPLPDKATVDRMRLHIGERFIEGVIHEKELAKKKYQQALKQGKKASLVEQQRANLFTTSVANVAPGETVVIEIEYLEDLLYEDGTFSIRFPMTLTPRFIPGASLSDRKGSGWSADATRVPDASRITPPMVTASRGHRLTLQARVDAGVALEHIASRHHPITIDQQSQHYEVTLTNDTVPMDQDFELLWKPVPSSAPRALAFNEVIGGEAHYLLMVMPPNDTDAVPFSMPRDMVFIIDTSGSMHGASIAQAKRALLQALDGLQVIDRFNVIEFNSDTSTLFRRSMPVDTANITKARGFIQNLAADGGTNMRPALELALGASVDETRLRQIVFITDGSVGNESELYTLIEQRLGATRLFTVGIGSAPNSWFMRKSAELGRGAFVMISALHEVREKMDHLFNKIASPQVINIDVAWPDGLQVESYPGVVPDLYLGEPIIIKAKATATGPLQAGAQVTISGDSATGAWSRDLLLANKNVDPGIGALWARAKIAALHDDQRRGVDAQRIRQAIVDTALDHHLVSKYTSLVAVDKTPARPAGDSLRKEHVPNLLPYGHSMNAIFGFPATATDASLLQARGLALLVAALMLLMIGRMRREKTRAN
jgi:Ca-activated chloride channel family protein